MTDTVATDAVEKRQKPRRLAPPDPLTVTVGDASKITGLGTSTIYKLINDGTLETTTIGRRRLVVYASIARLVQPSRH